MQPNLNERPDDPLSGACFRTQRPDEPRALDPQQAFKLLAHWLAERTAEAPQLVVGLSGTDSILAFLLCAEANRLNGKPADALRAIHYKTASPTLKDLVSEHYTENAPLVSWLRQTAPVEIVELEPNARLDADAYRWADLQSVALRERGWIVGTRNRTEETLGNFSNASLVAVVQPLAPLWKTEVLDLCRSLKVPEGIISTSRLFDCACGTIKTIRNIDSVDPYLMAVAGEVDPRGVVRDVEASSPGLRRTLKGFMHDKRFKSEIPYLPPEDILKPAIRG